MKCRSVVLLAPLCLPRLVTRRGVRSSFLHNGSIGAAGPFKHRTIQPHMFGHGPEFSWALRFSPQPEPQSRDAQEGEEANDIGDRRDKRAR